MDTFTLTGLVTSGVTLLDAFDLNPLKLLGQQLSPKVVSYVKSELFGEPTYRQRLAELVDRLLEEYRAEYRVDSQGSAIYFFQTQWLWERVLTYQLFRATPPLQPADFPPLPHLRLPSPDELTQFNMRVAAAMAADHELSRRFYEENHQEITVQFALAASEQLTRMAAALRPQGSALQPLLDILERNELEQYKPFTTLRMLEHLADEVRRHPQDNRLQARYHYLLGRTRQETGQPELAHEHLLRAHALEPAAVAYAEQAALTYALLAMPAEAATVVTALRQADPLNGVAHAVHAFLHRADIATHLPGVPSVVRGQEKFKLTLVELLLTIKPFDFAPIKQILQADFENYTPATTLTFANRRFQVVLALLVVQLEFDTLPELARLDQPSVLRDSTRLRAAYQLLHHYTSLLQPTEKAPLLTHHYYVQGLAGFRLTGNVEELAEFGQRYASLSEDEKQLYGREWACALLQAGDYQQVLRVLDELGHEGPAELDYIRYHALLHVNAPAAKVALARHLQRGEPLVVGTFDRLFRYLAGHCADSAERLAFVNDCLARQLLAPGVALLVAWAAAVADEPPQREQAMDWLHQAAALQDETTPAILRLEMARLFQVLGDYARSAQALTGCPNAPGVQHSGAELVRLRNRYHLYQGGAHLREELRAWRHQHGVYPEFCNWEVELAYLLLDWERILEVTDTLKDQVAAETNVYGTYLLALHHLRRDAELQTALQRAVEQPGILTPDQHLRAAAIAMQAGHPALARHLAYPLASQPGNVVARGRYLALFLPSSEERPLLTTVAVGTSVRYEVDGRPQAWLTITEALLHSGSHTVVAALLGKQVGESFEHPHPMRRRPQRLTVVEVVDCYTGLLREILAEIDQNEALMPVQAFSFGSDTPTLEEINQTFVDLLGEQQHEFRTHAAAVRADYEAGNTTFTQLTAALHHGNGLEAYHWLTSGRDDSPGMRVLPGWVFGTVPNLVQQPIVLDWTSLPVLFALVQQHQLPPPTSLWVSHHLLAELRALVLEKQRSAPVEMSVEIVAGEARPHQYPPEMHARQLHYLTDLLDWVETNCQTRLVEEKLDIIRQTDISLNRLVEQPLAGMIDTAFLAAYTPEAVVVSDDASLLQLVCESSRGLSVEAFLRAMYPTQYNALVLPGLLDRFYWGIVVDPPTLLREFVAAGHQFTGRARQALRNAALQVHYQPAQLQNLAHFVRELLLLPGLTAARKRDASSFALCLGLCYLEPDDATAQLATTHLAQAFVLLPAYWPDAMQVLRQSWQWAVLHRQAVATE